MLGLAAVSVAVAATVSGQHLPCFSLAGSVVKIACIFNFYDCRGALSNGHKYTPQKINTNSSLLFIFIFGSSGNFWHVRMAHEMVNEFTTVLWLPSVPLCTCREKERERGEEGGASLECPVQSWAFLHAVRMSNKNVNGLHRNWQLFQSAFVPDLFISSE